MIGEPAAGRVGDVMPHVAVQDRHDGPPPLIVLGERSAAIRHLLGGRLRRQGMSVLEAVDGFHALHTVTASRPDGLVIANNLGRLDGAALVDDLGDTEKAAEIPCVIVVDGDSELASLRVKSLRPNVRPIVRPRSLEALCSAIGGALEEHPRASRGTQETVTTLESPRSERLRPEIDALTKAFGYFDEVVSRFKTNRLPGPMLPGLLREITDLAADPDVDLRRLIKITEKHQAVALRLLALANSALYCQAGSPVTTIDRAIVKLGIQKTVAVFRAVGMLGYVVGPDKKLRDLVRTGLRKACFVAHAAEYLASLDGGVVERELFTLGLLHNAGATFLLYTLALLQQQGHIEALDHEAVMSMVASGGPQLTQHVAAGLNLPADMASLLLVPASDSSAAEHSPAAMILLRAIWIAETVLDQKRDLLESTAESASLGLDVDLLSEVNAKLPELLQVSNIYIR